MSQKKKNIKKTQQGHSKNITWSPQETAVWMPPAEPSLPEWTERNINLGPWSEEKGPLRLSRTPYLIPILNMQTDPQVERTVFCKSTQIAGTTALCAIAGYHAAIYPCPIMVVLADQNTMEYIAEIRIQGMFRASTYLSQLIIEDKFNLDEITLVNGAYLCMAWASSVSKLATRVMRVVLLDEVDKPGYYMRTREGSAIGQAIQRTETYRYGKKIFETSTPTLETGHIWQDLNACQVIYDFHVECPYCGLSQPLAWSLEYCVFDDGFFRGQDGKMYPVGMVFWEGGDEATDEQVQKAGYRCGQCSKIWNTTQKNIAVEQGAMIPRHKPPSELRMPGIHIWRAYSLLGKSGDLAELVRHWLSVRRNGIREELQVFINHALALPFKQTVIKSTAQNILKARCGLKPQVVPAEAIALTAGIDLQKYGFWFVVRAWTREYWSWLIHYGFLSTWDDLETLLFETSYPVQDYPDLIMPICRAAIDTGGGPQDDKDLTMTEEVYWWLRRNAIGRGARIWGTKGSSHPLASKMNIGKTLDKTPSGKPIPGGLQLVLLDTAKIKDTFIYRLGQAIESEEIQPAFLHEETGEDYAKQIMAEEKRIDRKTGLETWTRIKRDNHYIDCEVGAHACADPEWPMGGIHLMDMQTIDINQSQNGQQVKQQGTTKKATTRRPRKW